MGKKKAFWPPLSSQRPHLSRVLAKGAVTIDSRGSISGAFPKAKELFQKPPLPSAILVLLFLKAVKEGASGPAQLLFGLNLHSSRALGSTAPIPCISRPLSSCTAWDEKPAKPPALDALGGKRGKPRVMAGMEHPQTALLWVRWSLPEPGCPTAARQHGTGLSKPSRAVMRVQLQ